MAPKITTEPKLARKPALSAEAKAGMLLAFSLAVFLGFIFIAGSVQMFGHFREVGVLFNYVSGLEANSPVFYGGLEVGKVKKLSLMKTPEASKVRVTLSLPEEAVVHEDSQVYIEVLGFMGEKYIEITPGSTASPVLGPGKMLQGTDPVPLMEIVKDGRELLDEFNGIADSLENLVGKGDKIVGDNQQNLNEIFANLNESSKNLKEMTADLKTHPWKLLRKSEKKKKRFLIF
ncbi:MAG: MCE family protein [Candidatus Omnitrophica bacterium]|nr:MCE family protein [Candidatus Omnitrophota bacterium]